MCVLVINVIWFVSIFWFNRKRGSFALLGISAIVMVMQLLAEGYRSHLIPLYLLFVILAALSFRGQKKSAVHNKTVIHKAVVSILWFPYFTLCALLPAVFPVFTYPLPTGPYSIGTVVYDVIDTSRDERLLENHSGKRKLAIQVWYPTDPDNEAEKTKWLTNPQAIALGMESLTKIPSYLFDHLQYIETHGMANVPVSLTEPRYPVILFSHGYGSGFRSQSLFQIQELASQGYIVVTIDHTYYSLSSVFTDGHAIPFYTAAGWPMLNNEKSREIVDTWVQDARFVMDQLEIMNKSNSHSIVANRMDLSKVGYLGASFGGPVAARTMQLDERVKAAINQDARPFYQEEILKEGLTQPFMYMQSTQGASKISDAQLHEYGLTRKQWDALPLEINQDIERFFHSLRGHGYILRIEGTEHITFSDMYLLIRIPFSKKLGIHDAHQIINEYTVAFFNRHLLGKFDDKTPLGQDKYNEIINLRSK